MKEFIKGNKLVSIILGFLLTVLMTYNGYTVLWRRWVTNQIYCQDSKIDSHINVQVAEDKKVSEQIKDVKEDVKEIKNDLATMRKEAGEESIKVRKENADNQATLLKLLIDIKRKQ